MMFLDSSAVEHSAVNRRVAGSNPARGVFSWLVGQVVKTRPFHGCNRGSNPLRVMLFSWRRSQVVRQWSAKPLCIGSNPIGACWFCVWVYSLFCLLSCMCMFCCPLFSPLVCGCLFLFLIFCFLVCGLCCYMVFFTIGDCGFVFVRVYA